MKKYLIFLLLWAVPAFGQNPGLTMQGTCVAGNLPVCVNSWTVKDGGVNPGSITLGTSAVATNPQRSGQANTGLFSPLSNQVDVAVGGTQQVTIGTTGVGIGTSTMKSTLEVNGVLTIDGGTGSNPAIISIHQPQGILEFQGDSSAATGGQTFFIVASPNAYNSGNASSLFQIFDGNGQLDPNTNVLEFDMSAQFPDGADIGTFQYSGTGHTPNMHFQPFGGNTLINEGGGNVSVGDLSASLTPPAVFNVGNGSPFQVATTGFVGIGTAAGPRVSLDIGGEHDAVILPIGTTGQRPTAVNGMIRYNTTPTPPVVEAYINSVWQQILSGSNGTPTCGTGCSSITANSTNARGSMTVTALATSAAVNFSATLPSAPFCTCSGSLTTSVASCTDTTSVLTATLSVGVTGDVITWNCPQ